jgi:hypothetical protein
MREVQLYIEGQRVDLFKDETISVTQSIQNVKDIAKVFTDFSKTFTLPASKANNKIFKHYYNYDIANTFDARIKVAAEIKLNYVTFKKGKIKLEGVDLKDNKPNIYRITFFGNLVSMKDLLGDSKLNDLSFSDLDTLYSPTNIGNGLTANPETNDLIVPLITHTQRLYYDTLDNNHNTGNLYPSGNKHGVYWNQLKFALRVNKIINQIEAKFTKANGYATNLTFSSDYFKNTDFDTLNNLFLWLHRKSGAVENFEGSAKIESSVDTFDTTFYSEYFDISCDGVNVLFGNCPDSLSYLTLQFFPASGDLTTPYDIRIATDSDDNFYTSTNNTGNVSVNLRNLVDDDCDLFGYTSYSVYVSTAGTMEFSNILWSFGMDSYPIYSAYGTYSTGTFNTSTVFQFVVSQQMPEMKIIDFLTGLMKMFNLTAFVDEDNSDEDNTVIKVITLDDYYALGRGVAANTEAWEITKYIDKEKSTVNVALPFREIQLKYKDTNTFLANRFRQVANKEWGAIEYTTGEQELDGRIYKVEVPFSHMMFERIGTQTGTLGIQWGWSVDESQNATKGEPLLFYPVKRVTNIFNFVSELNEDGTAKTVLTFGSANLPSNSVEMPNGTTPTDKSNIHFHLETNEWTRNTTFTDTLFKDYYKDYVLSLFEKKQRLTKLTAYLPLKILLNFNLSDRFVVNGKRYFINNIDTNLQTGESQIELLNDI